MDEKMKAEQEILDSIDPGAGPGADIPHEVMQEAEKAAGGSTEV